MNEEATTPELKSDPEIRALRYALLAGVSTLFTTMFVVAVMSGTHEFLELAVSSGLMFGLCPAAVAGTVVALIVELLLGRMFGTSKASAVIRRRTYRLCIVLPLLLGLGLAVKATRPRSHLRSMLGTQLPSSLSEVRVAGFNSFLARRWYASFTISTNELLPLVKQLDLASTTNLDLMRSFSTNGPFAQKAVDSGVIPQWSAHALWSRSKDDGQASWWSWLAVDATGTNVFFTTGYQN